MDGTLFSSDKKILDSSKEKIREAFEAGKTICISTGRCMPEVRDILRELPEIHYVIGAGGAFVFDVSSDGFICENPIPAVIVTEVMKLLRGIDIQIVLMAGKAYTQRDKAEKMGDYNMGAYQPEYLRNFELPEDIISYYLQNPFDCYKINLYTKSMEDRDYTANVLEELPLACVFAEGTSIEYTQPEVNKGLGLMELCRTVGIDLDTTIVVGDANNDLAAMEAAGLAVAMGNANENVRKIADVMVADNDSGGCAEAIERYLLGD